MVSRIIFSFLVHLLTPRSVLSTSRPWSKWCARDSQFLRGRRRWREGLEGSLALVETSQTFAKSIAPLV